MSRTSRRAPLLRIAEDPRAPLIDLDRVTCRYGHEPVLVNVDLTLRAGDFIGIVGPSGSGKSTLLKTIAGAITPVAGSVRRGEGLAIGYVPQVETVNWYFPITVREAVLMARIGDRRTPWSTPRERAEADEALERLGLGGLGGRHIRELSGGQQQRVFVARAMLRRPALLLLDEPTSGVDVRTRHDVMHLIHELHHDGLAIALTTHDLNGIAAHLPSIMCLNREVIATGAPGDILTSDVLERTYGAPLEVLSHGGMPVVVEQYQTPWDTTGPAAGEGHHVHPVHEGG
jgi:ABC-type Mn2+/Zn2+ transport system ATPase subunit